MTLQVESLEATAYNVLKVIPSLRNLLQPVNRLPPETLSHIVQHVPHEKARDTRSIIPLTHVCRYWRRSIVSTPGNWTFISSRNKDVAALSLQRAKAAPLQINLDMDQVRKNPGFSDLIAPYIRNTETLHVCCLLTTKELMQTLPNFPRSTPNLRSLSLFPELRDAEWDLFTDHRFGPLIPTLTHLSLMNIPLYPAFLHLKTLTDLTLRYLRFNLHLDAFLDFLEGNRSLERATLDIQFTQPSLRHLRHRVAIRNRLRNLSIYSANETDNNPLISNIALQRGAHLEITLYDMTKGLDEVLSYIYAARLSNLESPTFMEYHPEESRILLHGPNGSFSFETLVSLECPFSDSPILPLTNVRVFRIRRTLKSDPFARPIAFPPSSFPALETFGVESEVTVSHLFSALFSNPSSCPSLKTLAFLDCHVDDGFMEELTRFSSNRKRTTSARLHRVVIVDSKGILPRFASIDALGKHVPIVDARIGKELPADLM